MARLLSVKLKDSVLKEAESVLSKSSKSRNAYINEAVDFYNRLQMRKKLKGMLREESRLVSASSMEVLEAFEKFEDDIGD